MSAEKSLKARNLSWMAAFVTFDALLLLVLFFGTQFEAVPLTRLTAARIGMSLFAPVLVLLASSLISSSLKSVMVFWRIEDVLPGHRAFSIYGKKDPRIKMDALSANVGPLPVAPRDQNALWYRLYRKVESDLSVAEAQKLYLLFRDMSAISVLLALVVPLVLGLAGASALATTAAAVFFIAQYLLTVIAARNHGVRFVTNVLSLHSLKKYR